MQRAATVAAHRELVGHEDTADALGPAPKPGQVEAYASWRAAWRALGRPEADRAEAEMSVGQLRVRDPRLRAGDRPGRRAYVANELAGTRQAADKHRRDAAVRRAEAEAERATQRRSTRPPTWNGGAAAAEAEQAEALAAALDARAAELAEADEARAQWYAHTAETRAAADRARAELTARAAAGDLGPDEPAVTAEEWLASHDAATRAEDPHREITAEHEVADLEAQRERRPPRCPDRQRCRPRRHDRLGAGRRRSRPRTRRRGDRAHRSSSDRRARACAAGHPPAGRTRRGAGPSTRRRRPTPTLKSAPPPLRRPRPTTNRRTRRSADHDEDTVRVPSVGRDRRVGAPRTARAGRTAAARGRRGTPRQRRGPRRRDSPAGTPTTPATPARGRHDRADRRPVQRATTQATDNAGPVLDRTRAMSDDARARCWTAHDGRSDATADSRSAATWPAYRAATGVKPGPRGLSCV